MADKEKISVTLDPTQVVEISDLVGTEYESRSGAVRALIDQRLEYGDTVDELKQENERLQHQLATTNRRVDEHQELVAYVEEERELQQR